MRALILAAGRGERLRPLTDHTPKPLLAVRGKPLIEWHIEALSNGGVRDIVINTAWLGEQFPARLGDGSRLGVRLHYSDEQAAFGGALETAGGIATALPLLQADDDEAFWVVSGDVFLPEFRFEAGRAQRFADGQDDAHLWLVPNAPHHPQGDFAISPAGRAALQGEQRHTWGSVGLFRAAMFGSIEAGTRMALRPLLDAGIAAGRIGAELYPGPWTDVGTVERLNALNNS
ncbi:MAG: nucleotidyltransferase family protein [Burkholderiaceae bacterium]|nr:nucleotidyltransferase family protein [Burkholderiaceae bacterium]